MPHECVSCGHVLEDGSDAVFEGCPDCGDATFAYVKEAPASEAASEADTSETTTREYVEEDVSDDDIVEAESSYDQRFGGKLDETPADESTQPSNSETDADTNDELNEVTDYQRARPDETRQHLMDQFETIRIVEPGSYELNLMNLYEGDEKVIALQEDGRYQVSLGSGFDN